MREILFRGKRMDDGKWVHGYLFLIWERAYILWGTTNGVPNMIEVDPATIGQYTGLTDKNGARIFEGDICRHRVSIGGEILEDDVGPVCLRHGSWTIIDKFVCVAVGQCSPDDLEVIGNIHDNPELLREAKDG